MSHIEGQPRDGGFDVLFDKDAGLDSNSSDHKFTESLSSRDWRGMLFVDDNGLGTVMFVEDHEDHSERIGVWRLVRVQDLPFEPQLKKEDGSTISIFQNSSWHKKPEMKVTLSKEVVRLG